MGFTKFGLHDQVMRGVQAAGYTTPTPIQVLAIPPALEGKDVIGCAQTGTGKTAAFVLPILHRLAGADPQHGRGRQKPRALVLTPTRELAQQVQDAAIAYGRSMQLRTLAVFGGASMSKQLALLQRGTDVIVATPGRLLDHLERGTIDLSQIAILVLDEADRMLDMGFIHDVKKIIARIPRERQTMLFSATISPEIEDLAAGVLRDPQTLDAGGRQNPVETIVQHFYSAPQGGKLDLLFHALEAEKMESVLVFSRTKHGADKICRRLERLGVATAAIHSNRTQPQRERALEGFREGKFRVLVATDIAARGIDVSGISHVINFDIPQYPEDYIHRIGRTGRAGAGGDAITFVGAEDQPYLRRIEQFTGKRFPLKAYPGVAASTAPPASERGPEMRRPERSRQRASESRETRERHATRKPQRTDTAPYNGGESRRPHSGSGTGPARRAPVSNEVPAMQENASRYAAGPQKKRPVRPGKKVTILATRKKKGSSKRLDSFSSDRDGGSWSNY